MGFMFSRKITSSDNQLIFKESEMEVGICILVFETMKEHGLLVLPALAKIKMLGTFSFSVHVLTRQKAYSSRDR